VILETEMTLQEAHLLRPSTQRMTPTSLILQAVSNLPEHTGATRLWSDSSEIEYQTRIPFMSFRSPESEPWNWVGENI